VIKRLLLTLGLALLPCVGVQAQSIVGPPSLVQCNQVTTGTGVLQIATFITGKNIVVCGYAADTTGAAGAFTLGYGTGSICGTNSVAIAPVFSGTSQGNFAIDHLSYAYFSLPTGVNLCVIASTNTSYAIYWGQY
jgi:hypothetical protein